MTLGNIIKEYRTKYDLSMDAFSERSGISKSYISLLEKNKHPKTGKGISPSIQCIKQAALGMNMDFDTLFGMLDGNVTIESSYENNNSDSSLHVSESSTYNATFSKLLSPNEEEMLKKYRELDQHGQDTINLILEREHQRCIDYALPQKDGKPLIVEQISSADIESATKERFRKLKNIINTSFSPLPDPSGNSPMGPETDEMCYQIEQAKKKNLHYLNSYTDIEKRDAVIKAAHNDSSDPAEIEKMMQDLENLKRPE